MQNRRCQLFCSLLLLMWDYTIALQIRGFGGSAQYTFLSEIKAILQP